jgi:hypothetical protein
MARRFPKTLFLRTEIGLTKVTKSCDTTAEPPPVPRMPKDFCAAPSSGARRNDADDGEAKKFPNAKRAAGRRPGSKKEGRPLL